MRTHRRVPPFRRYLCANSRTARFNSSWPSVSLELMPVADGAMSESRTSISGVSLPLSRICASICPQVTGSRKSPWIVLHPGMGSIGSRSTEITVPLSFGREEAPHPSKASSSQSRPSRRAAACDQPPGAAPRSTIKVSSGSRGAPFDFSLTLGRRGYCPWISKSLNALRARN